MKKILVVLGATSTGKTEVALQLARKFDGELVSCDSRQVYRGLDIGTGKDGANAWMYDVADPKKQYSVFDYVKDANNIIEDILNRGKLPIIVGGTGLYLKALLEGMPNLGIPVDEKLRKQLSNLTLKQLQLRLQKSDPVRWSGMNSSDSQNPRRLIRVIEIATLSLRGVKRRGNLKRIGKIATLITPRVLPTLWWRARNDILKIGLTAPRQILYQRIDGRVISRINQGMIDEARRLHEKGLSFERMRRLGLEYGVLADYLDNKIKSEEELIKILQGKINGYARRQIAWFKKENNVIWFDITDPNFPEKLEKEAAKWYYHADAAKD